MLRLEHSPRLHRPPRGPAAGDGHVGVPRLALAGFGGGLGHQSQRIGLFLHGLELALRGFQLHFGHLTAVLRPDQRGDLVAQLIGGLLGDGRPALEQGGEGMGHRFHLRGEPGVLDGAD